MPPGAWLLALAAALAGAVAEAWAQPVDAAPVPVHPETIARHADGRVTVRAVRLSTPLRVDGRLDDAVYREVHRAGQAATERTDVWLL